MGWWVSYYVHSGQFIELVSWIFWVLLSMTLHELAHGWVAIWQGDDTPIQLQRLTLNPVVHMGVPSLVMFALCGIAWGAMPVNPHRFKDGHRGDIYVSVAGPAMNVLIALVCLLLLTFWGAAGPQGSALSRDVTVFLYYGVALNFILAPFNLLPIPPLDGSHILAGIFPRVRRLYGHPQAAIFGMFVFLAIFFMSPMGQIFFRVVDDAARSLVNAVGGLVGNPPLEFGLWG